ncbi:ABC transporter ATP-binding protein [Actinomyces sp. 2119]|uniref:ABC transporter ATP-binding protein n=1 Tax=Actinomyces sp. 2119 TaxID=2321393 RepID=UPI000E6D41D3|nr:ABC transporter ATP-binding protein [Actinomyces sp. 2119]RJF42503.1 ABC transporter ATP-binding protein [Actinomyces sp. 2119]
MVTTAPSSSSRAIDVRSLDKSYGRFRALTDLCLHLDRGEVLGFLGPNGAGKSTTIRVLLGLLRHDAGTVRVLGQDPWRDVVELHQRMAYVPGDVSLWPSMTGGEAIDLLGSLRGGLSRTRRQELIERFELDPTKRGRQYSKGNRQKVAIIAALASDAELLVLDEPTSGLDPLMEEAFQVTVQEAKDRGASVLLSSHIMSEVENLADRVSIIRNGTIAREGTLEELRSDSRSTVHATLGHAPGDTPGDTPGDDELDSIDGLEEVTLSGARLTALVRPDQMGRAMASLSAIGIRTLQVEPPSLESLFLDLYQDDPQDGADSRQQFPAARKEQ